MSTWDAAVVDKLIELCGKGQSTSLVVAALNAEFGLSLSNSSVLGKIYRLRQEGVLPPAPPQKRANTFVFGQGRKAEQANTKRIASEQIAVSAKAARISGSDIAKELHRLGYTEGQVAELKRKAFDPNFERRKPAVYFHKRKPDQCSFILGAMHESSGICCGKPVILPGASFCADHCCVVYKFPKTAD